VDLNQFRDSLKQQFPPLELSDLLAALWWDAKGDWAQAHRLVDELETRQGMAIHAYLHRKEGASSNAEYWYARVGPDTRRPTLDAEWEALVTSLLAGSEYSR